MASGAAGYKEVTEWRTVPGSYSHGSHAMIYAQWPGKFLGKYDYKYAVFVSIAIRTIALGVAYSRGVCNRCSCVMMGPWVSLEV